MNWEQDENDPGVAKMFGSSPAIASNNSISVPTLSPVTLKPWTPSIPFENELEDITHYTFDTTASPWTKCNGELRSINDEITALKTKNAELEKDNVELVDSNLELTEENERLKEELKKLKGK